MCVNILRERFAFQIHSFKLTRGSAPGLDLLLRLFIVATRTHSLLVARCIALGCMWLSDGV
jgi:hypothetical protein